jgi:hypothetical protein
LLLLDIRHAARARICSRPLRMGRQISETLAGQGYNDKTDRQQQARSGAVTFKLNFVLWHPLISSN